MRQEISLHHAAFISRNFKVYQILTSYNSVQK